MATKYYDASAAWLLPAFMRRDALDSALAGILDEFGADLHSITKTYPTWGHIAELDEDELDELAEEMAVTWYDRTASVESKREVLANARLIQRKLGTKWAIEEVLNVYFPESEVIEWPRYGGTPGHFRIESEYDTTDTSKINRFLRILGSVKRASQVLDDIILTERSDTACPARCRLSDYGTVAMEVIR